MLLARRRWIEVLNFLLCSYCQQLSQASKVRHQIGAQWLDATCAFK